MVSVIFGLPACVSIFISVGYRFTVCTEVRLPYLIPVIVVLSGPSGVIVIFTISNRFPPGIEIFLLYLPAFNEFCLPARISVIVAVGNRFAAGIKVRLLYSIPFVVIFSGPSGVIGILIIYNRISDGIKIFPHHLPAFNVLCLPAGISIVISVGNRFIVRIKI